MTVCLAILGCQFVSVHRKAGSSDTLRLWIIRAGLFCRNRVRLSCVPPAFLSASLATVLPFDGLAMAVIADAQFLSSFTPPGVPYPPKLKPK